MACEPIGKLLSSVDALVRPGGLVVLSYAHHIPGLEADDDAFFALAADCGLIEVHRSTEPMRHMWDPAKTVTQYLVVLQKRADGDGPCEPAPSDEASLAQELRRRASEIARAEDSARALPLALQLDEQGRALPMTMPGPRAPRNEDHPGNPPKRVIFLFIV